MSAHTYHPDSYAYGLADDCPRCAEHAEQPFDTLDDENLLALAIREERGYDARSDTEARAMAALARHRRAQARLEGLRGLPAARASVRAWMDYEGQSGRLDADSERSIELLLIGGELP